MRRTLPMMITAIIGFLIVVDGFVTNSALRTWSSTLQNWGVVIAAFALGLGAVNLLQIHGKKVVGKQAGWVESSVLLLGLVGMIVTGILQGASSPGFLFLFRNFYEPLGAAMFSMMVFFIASASFRAFRARSKEAAVLLISGVVLMLGRAPVGEVISPMFPDLADWLMQIPNLAGNRGIMIGAAVGIVSVSFRVLIGIDRGYLGQD